MPSVVDVHVEALHLLRQLRIEPQNVPRDFDPSRDTLHQIDGSRHGAEMYALRGGALLDIAHVALQSLCEVAHRARPVRARQYPCMDHTG